MAYFESGYVEVDYDLGEGAYEESLCNLPYDITPMLESLCDFPYNILSSAELCYFEDLVIDFDYESCSCPGEEVEVATCEIVYSFTGALAATCDIPYGINADFLVESCDMYYSVLELIFYERLYNFPYSIESYQENNIDLKSSIELAVFLQSTLNINYSIGEYLDTPVRVKRGSSDDS